MSKNSFNDIATLTTLGRKVSDAYPDKLFAFISGSLVEGFGNASSDLDVFIVTKDDSRDLPAQGSATRFRFEDYAIDVDFQDRRRIDTEVWQLSKIMNAVSSIANCGLDTWVAASTLDEKVIDLAHRIRIGVPVAGDEEFAATKSGFDWERLRRILCHRFLNDYNAQAEDAAGAIKANDFGSALIMSRIVLGSALDALLAAHGMTNPKPKWRYRKLLAHNDQKLLKRYLEIEVEPDDNPAGILSRARDRVRFATEIAGSAQLVLLGEDG